MTSQSSTGKKKLTPAQKKHYRAAKDEAIKDFLTDLTFVIKSISDKHKKDALMADLYDKFTIVRKENPDGLIEMAGPYIWKYREEIKAQNVSFFLKNDFEADIIAARKQKEIAEVTQFEDIPILLDKCKRTWHMFQPQEQEVMIKKVRSLLISYAKYVSVAKPLNNDEV